MKETNIINNIEAETGREYTDKEKVYALHYVTSGNKAESARQAGYSDVTARQRGHELSLDPDIQLLVDGLKKYQSSVITEDFIKAGLLKEALTADQSRDRREALHLLAKNKGMMKDVVEQTTITKDDETLLDEIEKRFGNEARDKAAIELGLH